MLGGREATPTPTGDIRYNSHKRRIRVKTSHGDTAIYGEHTLERKGWLYISFYTKV